jgi:hypothetical protein
MRMHAASKSSLFHPLNQDNAALVNTAPKVVESAGGMPLRPIFTGSFSKTSLNRIGKKLSSA